MRKTTDKMLLQRFGRFGNLQSYRVEDGWCLRLELNDDLPIAAIGETKAEATKRLATSLWLRGKRVKRSKN